MERYEKSTRSERMVLESISPFIDDGTIRGVQLLFLASNFSVPALSSFDVCLSSLTGFLSMQNAHSPVLHFRHVVNVMRAIGHLTFSSLEWV